MESGEGITAAQEREAVLASRNGATAEADAQLRELLGSAHRTAARCAQRLDAIERSIDEAVTRQSAKAFDTATEAREFQRFLADKHREILSVLDDAQRGDSTLQDRAKSLTDRYVFPDTADPGAHSAAISSEDAGFIAGGGPMRQGTIIWCSPATLGLGTGYICEHLQSDGSIIWRHSPIDITGGMP